MIDNSLEQVTIRRSQNTLRIVGMGIIVFTLWTVVKYVGIMLFRKDEMMAFIRSGMGDGYSGASDTLFMAVFAVLFGSILLIGLSIQLFVGISALREGQGKHSFFIYIPMAFLMVCSSVLTILSVMRSWFTGGAESADSLQLFNETSVSAVIIELTSMIMMIQMIVSARRVRKYKRKEERAAAEKGV